MVKRKIFFIILLCFTIFAKCDEIIGKYNYYSNSNPATLSTPQISPYYVTGNAFTLTLW